ncbi:hypothetical protein [Paractinoplanes maris]|uniref:hypothetical protein n=1 Tax=Paractinoplanes maris TaxID=1734446 RepID=UPI002020BF74|nr:hypothetical protein [Actinoplanes maris]
MTGRDVPRGVRVATLLAGLMVPVGVLLLVAGVLDLAYWSSPGAGRLTALMDNIQAEYGTVPPAMIRAGRGAVLLVVLGLAGIAYAVLAPLIFKGVRWARSWALGAGAAIFLIGLMTIGSDASQPIYLKDYYATLTGATIGDRIPLIEAQLYPAWYPWLEDAAQGLATLAALGVVIALIWAVVSHAEHFLGRGDQSEPDEWDTAIARMRATRKPSDQG